MVILDSSNLAGLTKNIYGPAELKNLFNLASPLNARIGSATQGTLGGAGFFFAVKDKINNSGLFTNPDGQVPTALAFDVQQAKVVPKAYMISNEVTAFAAELASGNLSSFVPVVTEAIADSMAAAAADHEVAVFGDNTGKIGTIASVAGTVITLTDGITNFRVGMPVDAINITGTQVGASTTVTDVNYVNNTITVAVSTSFAATNGLYRTGTQAGAGTFADRSFDGLTAGVADSGTYLNIDPASYPRWKGNVENCQGAPLDEDVLERAKVRLMQEIGRSRNAMNDVAVILNPRQYRALQLSSYSRSRYDMPNRVLGADVSGFVGLGEIIESPFAPEDAVYVGDMDELQRFETPNGALQISTDLGMPEWRFVTDYLKARMIIRSFSNVVVTNRRAWVKLSNLGNTLSR